MATRHGDDHDDQAEHGLDHRCRRTWPDSTAAREMAMVRNRATMPSVMSVATEMAVPCATAAMAMSRIAGHDVRRGTRARPPLAAAEPGAERAAEDVDEQQEEHDRHARSSITVTDG